MADDLTPPHWGAPQPIDATPDAATTALAASLYDDEHTARLVEHPEDAPAYYARAENVRRWLRSAGYDVAPISTQGGGA